MATKMKGFVKKAGGELKDHQLELTEKIIESMEQSKALNWERPWFVCNELPYNPVTGTKYKGINIVSLMTAKFDDPRFMTFKNVEELAQKTGNAIHVKKGAKGIPVFKAVQVVFADKDSGDSEGEELGAKSFWKMKYAGTVFNASQIEGLEPYVKRDKAAGSHEEFDHLVEALKAKTNLKIEHSEIGRAYYSPSEHLVHMPNKEKFKSLESYMDTALHEFGHSTGPALGRDMSGGKGTAAYAKEELVAELSSVFMAAEIGVSHDIRRHENHAAYLDSWLQALKNDKSLIFSAAQKASKATEYQMSHLETYKQESRIVKSTVIETPVLDIPKAEKIEEKKSVALAM
jgi:antirestriction protein ArdC